MKKIILIIILVAISLNLSAHEGGHGTPLKKWKFASEKGTVKADFVKSENSKVWLMDHHNIKVYQITDFSTEDQSYINYIKTRNESINSINTKQTSEVDSGEADDGSFSFLKIAFILSGGFLLTLSLFQLVKRKRIIHISYGFLGGCMILFILFKNNVIAKSITDDVPQNNVSLMKSFFEKFDGVKTHSDDKFLYISSNGLPDHEMMME